MNFDPRVVAPQPGAVILPDMAVVEQEMLNAGVGYDQAEAALVQASRELGDSQLEETAANMVQQLNQDMGLSLPVPSADDIAAAKAAIQQAAQGGTTMAVDPTIQQVLAQNALIADALYDLTKLAVAGEIAGAFGPASHADVLQDAKTKVNALNPGKFVFP